MLNIISTGSNYVIIIMCVIYAISCFTVFLPSSQERQMKRMNRQERYMFLFHFICYGVLFLQTLDVKIIILYVVEVMFFLILIFLYEHLYPDSSRILMNHTCFLLLIGFVMLTRLSFDQAVRQFLIAVVSSVLVLIVPFIVAKAYWLKRLRWVYGLIGLAFLSTVFVIGTTKNGSTNWISLGSIALQPSEFVKIAFVFFIAAMLEKPASFRNVMVTTLFSAAHVVVLIMEKDLGGALLYFVVFIFMCYAATGRFIYMLGGVSLGTLAGYVAYQLFSHVRTRFAAWIDPWSDIENTGYQITQSLFAIGTGSWFGLGLTQGRPTDIPVVESDFIFAAIAEEFGVFFALCLILIYLGIFVHFLKIAMDVKGRFYKLVAYGFSICFIFQVFLNIGGVTKFIPSTGVTLPLISYGGSSVASTLIIFAIMQGIFIIAYQEDEEGGDDGQTTEIENAEFEREEIENAKGKKTGNALDGTWKNAGS